MASSSPPSDALAAWLAGARWFAAKAQRIARLAIEDRVPFGAAELLVLAVTLEDGSVERYAVPLRAGVLADALDDARFCRTLLDLVAAGARAPGDRGAVIGTPTRAFPADLAPDLEVRRLGGEQSNTSVAFGDRLILKHFRRLVEGVNPDQEIGAFLTERTTFRNVPRLAGHLEYQAAGYRATLGVVHELVAGGRDGWEWAVAALGDLLRRAAGTGAEPDPVRLRPLASDFLAALRRLGERTAELHLALASDLADPRFAPEPITSADVGTWAAAIRRQMEAARSVARGQAVPALPDTAAALAPLVGRRKIRHHGDFHLGQTLRVEERDDFVIIDFEGEPARPLQERRRKHAAVRDVAGMLRSFDYAAATAAQGAGGQADGWARAWESEARAAFLAGYLSRAAGAPFLPGSADGVIVAVAAFEVEKAAYEIVYEANTRPGWMAIPLAGLVRACARLASAPAAASPTGTARAAGGA